MYSQGDPVDPYRPLFPKSKMYWLSVPLRRAASGAIFEFDALRVARSGGWWMIEEERIVSFKIVSNLQCAKQGLEQETSLEECELVILLMRGW